MARFLVDEDLPRSIARLAAARAVDAVHVFDLGLRGEPDSTVLAAAVAEGRTLVTADKEFGNIIVYPPDQHAGVVLARLPDEIDPDQRIERIVDVMVGHAADDLGGSHRHRADTGAHAARSRLTRPTGRASAAEATPRRPRCGQPDTASCLG